MNRPMIPSPASELTRRDFLHRAATAALGAAVAGRVSPLRAGPTDSPTTQPQSLVVRVQGRGVIVGRLVREPLLAEMLDKSLMTVTGTSNAEEAWHNLLKPDDIIGLKFNRCGEAELATTLPLAGALIRSLQGAGFSPDQIVPIEAPAAIYDEFDTARPDQSWQEQETSFGSGSDRLAGVLDQVTAIINVPFVKTHNIAGLSCCLKNLSHALVKHPARYHANHCCPFVADIVALPAIRDRLRLHLVNALRVVFDGGPEPTEQGTCAPGLLFCSLDPVALDAVSMQEINYQRLQQGLPLVEARDGLLAFLPRASGHGLGRFEPYDIFVQKVAL